MNSKQALERDAVRCFEDAPVGFLRASVQLCLITSIGLFGSVFAADATCAASAADKKLV